MSVKVVSLYKETEAMDIDVLILSKLTNFLPTVEIKSVNLTKIKELPLADPHFNRPGVVDMIIGADRFFSVLREGRVDNLEDRLIAQNSIFGWLLSGETAECTTQSNSLGVHVGISVDETLREFWEIEEIPMCNPFSKEETECEQHFKINFTRHVNGKYIVKLPFKQEHQPLGNSLNIAKKRFLNLERRLDREPQLKLDYSNIIREYITLGHLSEMPNELAADTEEKHYYLPHHAVTKDESTTTKLRVVFDGSSKTTNGNSINDLLMVGPTIQPTLWTTLLKFRYNKIAFTADIEKMYRQVMVAEEDQEFQRILWREKANQPIAHYKLTTVTFGMASSAFLAIRSLQQVAFDFQQKFPLITEEILNKFYIDDYLSGADTVEEAKYLKEILTDTLRQRGFNLRKWKSNAKDLQDQPIKTEDSLVSIEEARSTIKILGLQWNSEEDQLSFKVNLPEETNPTKRTLISNASKVFDPLGLLSPSIIMAKILYQKLWLRKLEWDDEL